MQWLLDAAIEYADAVGPENERPGVSFYIEDLPAWGPIAELVERLATLRSRRIAITAAIQSFAQLELAYGPTAKAVEKAFVNKIVLPGVNQEDAEYFARTSGEQQIAVTRMGTGALLDESILSSFVLSPSEIRSPEYRHFFLEQPLTFVLPGRVFQAYLPAIFDQPETADLRRRANRWNNSRPLRTTPLVLPEVTTDAIAAPSSSCESPTFTNTNGMPESQIRKRIEAVRKQVDYDNTTGTARRWWDAFETANNGRPNLTLRLLEELAGRKATLTEFFLAYVYSNTDNIQANLLYLDYTRLKRHEQAAKEALRASQNQKQVKPPNRGGKNPDRE